MTTSFEMTSRPILQNNNESEAVYTSHVLKDPNGQVVCPALYVYVCPICNNTGHQAHTVKHCPYNPEQLRRQTELAEIWRSYRETAGEPGAGQGAWQALAGSSQHNIHANAGRQSWSSRPQSPSPLSSPSSSFLSPNSSSSSSSSFSSPCSALSSPSRHPGFRPAPPQPAEHSVLMDNLIKLLQYSTEQ